MPPYSNDDPQSCETVRTSIEETSKAFTPADLFVEIVENLQKLENLTLTKKSEEDMIETSSEMSESELEISDWHLSSSNFEDRLKTKEDPENVSSSIRDTVFARDFDSCGCKSQIHS